MSLAGLAKLTSPGLQIKKTRLKEPQDFSIQASDNHAAKNQIYRLSPLLSQMALIWPLLNLEEKINRK